MTVQSDSTVTQSAFEPKYSTATALQAVRFAFRTSWMLSRPRTITIVGLPLVQGLLPAGLALVIRGLVNAVASDDSVPSDVNSWILLGLLLSFLLAAAVPAATPVIGVNVVEIPEMLLISVAVAVIAVPFNVKLPVDKFVNVPTDVIFG